MKVNLKSHLQKIRTQILSRVDVEKIKKSLQNFDLQQSMDWLSKAVQQKGATYYGTLATVVLSTYFVSDLTALLVSGYLPDSPPPALSKFGGGIGPTKTVNDYSAIYTRNLFNSQGLIPGEETPNSPNSDSGGTPVKSSLPFNLLGTLIMANELRSIATLEDKSSQLVFPMQIHDEIPGKLRVIKIEPRKVIFVNLGSNRREYLDLPEDAQLNIGARITTGAGAGIERLSATQFNVARTEIDKALGDFNNILTQARALPYAENGVPAGFKIFQIVPGSIYDKLGLQNGDVISGVNGQPITDPMKAMEMLQDLKTANHLELQVKKDGKQLSYSYDFH